MSRRRYFQSDIRRVDDVAPTPPLRVEEVDHIGAAAARADQMQLAETRLDLRQL